MPSMRLLSVPRGGAALSALALVGCIGSDPPSAPSGSTPPAAVAYMTAALDTLERHSINRYRIDWPAFRRDALSRIAGAVTTRDTYPALRATLAALGDHHSFFIPPDGGLDALLGTAGSAAHGDAGRAGEPTGQALPGGIGYVAIPDFSGSGTQATGFADALQDVVEAVDATAPCGWIVDLRENPGGNMWPMIAGVGPILGEGVLGAFVDPDSVRQLWFYRAGVAGVTLPGGRELVEQRVTGDAYRLARPAGRGAARSAHGELGADAPLGEDELNALGAQGWELTAVIPTPSAVDIYFKRARE